MRRVRKQGGQPPLAAFFLITSEVESHFSGLAYWFTAINLTYRVALYNFLSTFSATLCDTNIITATYRVCPGIYLLDSTRVVCFCLRCSSRLQSWAAEISKAQTVHEDAWFGRG